MTLIDLKKKREQKQKEKLLKFYEDLRRESYWAGLMPDSVKDFHNPFNRLDRIMTSETAEELDKKGKIDEILAAVDTLGLFKHYDRKGNSISMNRYHELWDDPSYRFLAKDEYQNHKVITIWNGQAVPMRKFFNFSTAVCVNELMTFEFHFHKEDEAILKHEFVFTVVRRSLQEDGVLNMEALKRFETRNK